MGKAKAIPEGYHSVCVYLNIKNADKAVEWYKKSFGATEIGRLSMPDGSIAHAELQFGDRIEPFDAALFVEQRHSIDEGGVESDPQRRGPASRKRG